MTVVRTAQPVLLAWRRPTNLRQARLRAQPGAQQALKISISSNCVCSPVNSGSTTIANTAVSSCICNAGAYGAPGCATHCTAVTSRSSSSFSACTLCPIGQYNPSTNQAACTAVSELHEFFCCPNTIDCLIVSRDHFDNFDWRDSSHKLPMHSWLHVRAALQRIADRLVCIARLPFTTDSGPDVSSAAGRILLICCHELGRVIATRIRLPVCEV